MTERRSLVLKAEKFLSSAHLLIKSGDVDSAVSRAYYAAFYIAEVLLDARGFSFSSHKGVISAYGQEFSKKGLLDSRFHRLLITAFEKRQQADYLANTGIDREEASELLSETEAFLQAAKAWLTKEKFLQD
jgi:uncharacterized protein (UPF0332 family)